MEPVKIFSEMEPVKNLSEKFLKKHRKRFNVLSSVFFLF